jgi:hypothetical protein
VFSDEIVVSTVWGDIIVLGKKNTCGVVINVMEMFVLFWRFLW